MDFFVENLLGSYYMCCMEKDNLKKFLVLPFLFCGIFSSILLHSLVRSEALEADVAHERIYFDYPPKVDFVNDEAVRDPQFVEAAKADLPQGETLVEKEVTLNKTKDQTETGVPIDRYSIALIVMSLQADGSAWDVTAGADLVICGSAGCYVSNGLEKNATFYEGGAGLRLVKKAGACRDSLACVFRDVDFSKLITEQNGLVEPVDVDYVSHAYMGGISYKKTDKINPLFSDDNCVLKKSVLDCKVGVHQRNYSLWVLPERRAKLGGKEALDAVLFKGLLHQRVATLTTQLLLHRERVQASSIKFYKTLFKGEDDVTEDLLKGCVTKPEFLSETFYVLGLADARERKAETLLIDLAGKLPTEKVRGLIQRTPQFFWAFDDLTQQLEDFANADLYTLDKEKTGVLLRLQAPKEMLDKTKTNDKKLETANETPKTEKNELIYGWKVKARAKAALSHCELEN